MNLLGIWRFICLLVKQFEKGEARKSAAHLTFVTLFAIVPLMTSGYVIASWLPWSVDFSGQFQTFVFQHFVPSSGELIQGYLKTFSEQAKSLTWLGLLILLFSAVSLMLTIEGSFNNIWRVKSKRVGTRIINYWLMLLLGPALLAGGFLISTYLLSSQLWLDDIGSSLVKNSLLVSLLPMCISTLALTLMYFFLPSCQIRLRHAAIGALVASILLELAKSLFVYLVSLTPSYEVVYGTFAMIPLFLLWLYIAWSLVLFGAQLVALLPFYHQQWRGVKASPLDWGLTICKALQGHLSGLSRANLMAGLSYLNSKDWEPVLQRLIKQGWVEDVNGVFYLGVDLKEVKVGGLSELIHEQRLDKLAVYISDSEWYEQLSPLFATIRHQKSSILDISIASVLANKEEPKAEL